MILSTQRLVATPFRRALLLALILLPSAYMYVRQILPALENYRIQPLPAPRLDLAQYPYPATSNTSVNLVIASLSTDDMSWTTQLRIPNLRIIRYVSDSTTAPYRPPVPRKGREATIYFQYLHDFYDDLPDVSILIHPHERAWHIDGVLQQSMLFSLSRLDLAEVQRRGYANLRVSWKDACPAWINTTTPPELSTKGEEPFMAAAFRDNFPAEPVPEIMAGPCCSQFAVTRDTIRRRPRDQYARSRDWLVQTPLTDYISGRTWEHMFPFLFLRENSDCAVEWKAYCRMYHICFDEPAKAPRYNDLWTEREDLKEQLRFFRELIDPRGAAAARKRTAEIDAILEEDIAAAIERGKDERLRQQGVGDLFSERT